MECWMKIKINRHQFRILQASTYIISSQTSYKIGDNIHFCPAEKTLSLCICCCSCSLSVSLCVIFRYFSAQFITQLFWNKRQQWITDTKWNRFTISYLLAQWRHHALQFGEGGIWGGGSNFGGEFFFGGGRIYFLGGGGEFGGSITITIQSTYFVYWYCSIGKILNTIHETKFW